MPLPTLPTTLPAACVAVLDADVPLVILPGGAALSAVTEVGGGDPGAILDAFQAQVGTALAPTKPVFDLIAAILSIKGVVDAIPSILTGNPKAFTDAVADLAVKITAVGKLIPQVTVPLMAKSILDTVIAGLRGVRAKMAAMIAAQARIDAASAKAASLPAGSARDALLQIIDCSSENLARQLVNENKAGSTINQLIALLNTIIQLVPGLPCVPTLGSLSGVSQAAIDSIDATIALLDALSGIFPAPDFALPALPEAGGTPEGC